MKLGKSLIVSLLLCTMLLISAIPSANIVSYAESDGNTVIQVSCDGMTTGILKKDGSLWMTGANGCGQLGDGSYADDNANPTRIMDNVTQVSCGSGSTGIVKQDGSLWQAGWYYTDPGEAGRMTPVKIMDNVKQVSNGGHAIIKKDGSLWMDGGNSSGELGDGTNIGRETPVRIMDNVKQVSRGMCYTAILTADGSLWVTGSLMRQFNDEIIQCNSPLKVGDNVEQVSCGANYTAVLTADGSLWMTGSNEYGQLGVDSNYPYGDSNYPYYETRPIKIMDNVAQVSCGDWHTGILKKDGSLWMTGYNAFGQLGDGTNSRKKSPIKIMDNVEQISCGGSCTAILKKDGSLWMTGDNRSGQHGDGTYNSKTTPVQIMPKIDSQPTTDINDTPKKEDASNINTGNNNTDNIIINKSSVSATDINRISILGATTVTLGPKVKKISKNAFKGTGITTILVKTKKLKKGSVKGSLKGSKVKTVKVQVGSKKINKKYVKKYKRFFTKKNAGKKAKVK